MASDSVLETPRPRRERLFDSGKVMAMLVVFFIGFWPSFIFRKPDFAGPPLTPLIHLHATIAIGRLLMLLSTIAILDAGFGCLPWMLDKGAWGGFIPADLFIRAVTGVG